MMTPSDNFVDGHGVRKNTHVGFHRGNGANNADEDGSAVLRIQAQLNKADKRVSYASKCYKCEANKNTPVAVLVFGSWCCTGRSTAERVRAISSTRAGAVYHWGTRCEHVDFKKDMG